MPVLEYSLTALFIPLHVRIVLYCHVLEIYSQTQQERVIANVKTTCNNKLQVLTSDMLVSNR